MNQSRLSSFVEAWINILIGYAVALPSQLVLFPLFDIHIQFTSNLWLATWFTGISLVRSYVIRRWFNARLHRLALRIAQE